MRIGRTGFIIRGATRPLRHSSLFRKIGAERPFGKESINWHPRARASSSLASSKDLKDAPAPVIRMREDVEREGDYVLVALHFEMETIGRRNADEFALLLGQEDVQVVRRVPLEPPYELLLAGFVPLHLCHQLQYGSAPRRLVRHDGPVRRAQSVAAPMSCTSCRLARAPTRVAPSSPWWKCSASRARDFRQIKAPRPQNTGSIPGVRQRRGGGKDPLSSRYDFRHGLLAEAGVRGIREALVTEKFFDLPSEITPKETHFHRPGMTIAVDLAGRHHAVRVYDPERLGDRPELARFFAVWAKVFEGLPLKPSW